MPPSPQASIGIALDEVDPPALVLDLDAPARAEGVRLDVLVEVNVGADRCGIAPGAPALALARAIAARAAACASPDCTLTTAPPSTFAALWNAARPSPPRPRKRG